MSILKKYHSFCENGIPNKNGLCQHFEQLNSWNLLIPTELELFEHYVQGFDTTWWGDVAVNEGKRGDMTPLRQNIILLLACLEGEL